MILKDFISLFEADFGVLVFVHSKSGSLNLAHTGSSSKIPDNLLNFTIMKCMTYPGGISIDVKEL